MTKYISNKYDNKKYNKIHIILKDFISYYYNSCQLSLQLQLR